MLVDPKQLQSHYERTNDPQVSQRVFRPQNEKENWELLVTISHKEEVEEERKSVKRLDIYDSKSYFFREGGSRVELAVLELMKEREMTHVPLLSTGTLVLTWSLQKCIFWLTLTGLWKTFFFFLFFLLKQKCDLCCMFVCTVFAALSCVRIVCVYR